MLYGIILGIHVIVCVALVLIVLMQAAKGGGLAGGSAFGGGAESTVFGGRGAATFLSKATTVFAAIFMLTSLSLTLLNRGALEEAPRSIVADEAARLPMEAPGTTAPPTEGTALPTGEAPTLPMEAPAGAEAPAPAGEGTEQAPPAGDGGSTEEAPNG
jgi:preprotein translocase subunit SecG